MLGGNKAFGIRVLDTWRPITADELQSLIDEQLLECTDAQRKLFEHYRVPLCSAPIERNGQLESVFIVAQRDNEVMYYEDFEEGFNFSPLTADGLPPGGNGSQLHAVGQRHQPATATFG